MEVGQSRAASARAGAPPEVVQQWVAFLRAMEASYARRAAGGESVAGLAEDERLAVAQLVVSLGVQPADAWDALLHSAAAACG